MTVDHEAYSALKLTDAARAGAARRAEHPVAAIPETGQRRGARPASAKGYVEADLSAPEQAIFDKLRWWRVETARKHNVPAYVIFNDATLREIAKLQPSSLHELRGVTGVGEKKLESYGADIIALIAEMA